MLGLRRTRKNRNAVRRRAPTPRSGPSTPLYVQDDFRVDQPADGQPRPALGRLSAVDRGRQPAVELRRDDRQVRRRVRRRGDRRRQGRPLPADLLEGRLRSALRLRLRPRPATARPSCAAASACSGTSRPAARRRRRRRTRRSSRRRRSTPTPTAYGVNLLLKDGLPPPPGVDPDTAGRRARRGRSSTSTSATRTRGSGTSTSSGSSAPTTWWRSPYVGSQGRQMLHQGATSNQAPPVVGVTDPNVNRPFIKLAPALRTIGQVQSNGTLDYNGAAGEVPAPLREQLLVPELVHLRQGDRPELRQRRPVTLTNIYDPGYNRGPADYDITPHVHRRAGSTSCRGRAASVYGGWQVSGILTAARRPAADGHADAGRAVDRHRQPAEPDLRRHALEPDDRSSGSTRQLLRGADRQHRHLRQRRPQHHSRARVVQHRRVAHQEHEDRPRRRPSSGSRRSTCSTIRSSRNPNTTIGNAAFGTISAMLSSPSCSLCGTVERQVQLGVKVRF